MSTVVFSQNCPFDNTFAGNMVHTFVGQTITESCITAGEYVAVAVTPGSTYEFSTCNSTSVDVTTTYYDGTGVNILATDDDGCGTSGGPSLFTGTTNFNGVVLVLVDEFPCLHGSTCINLEVTLISGTVCTPATGTDVINSCTPITWIDGNTYSTSNNTATHTISGGAASGCDSIVTLDLTINNNNTRTDVVTSCGDYTWIDGNTYTSSNNTATYTFPAPNGCDSIITLDLTLISNNAVVNTDPILVAVTSGASYQWLNCLDNYSVIAGKTDQSFIPESNGSYAVEVTSDGCTDTSDCYSVFSVSVDEYSILDDVVSIFPNPNQGIVNIELGELSDVKLNVLNLRGQIIYTEPNINTSQYQLNLDQPNGIYILEINYDGLKKRFKLVKED